MNLSTWYEIIGYVASLFVAISLMMSSLVKLRWLNLAGSLVFTVYGLLIQSYPVAAVNLFIALINMYYLYQVYNTRELFKLLEVPLDSVYLDHFLQFHEDEIQRFLPTFKFQPEDHDLAFFILRDTVPAGVFIAAYRSPGSLFVNLDFVVPGYRDFKIGRFLFTEKIDYFRQKGVQTLYSYPGTEVHRSYLKRMGFSPDGQTDDRLLYRLQLDRA